MTESQDHADHLARQLDRTRATWTVLESHGIKDGTALVLDYFFDCPSYRTAAALVDFLRRETDYAVAVTAHEDRWTVSGSTRPAPVSLPLLEQWVDWMVVVGARPGCAFDGWGAELP